MGVRSKPKRYSKRSVKERYIIEFMKYTTKEGGTIMRKIFMVLICLTLTLTGSFAFGAMTGEELKKEIDKLPWTGAGKQAVDLFNKAQEAKSVDAGLWNKLGLTLYDGKYYSESLRAFSRITEADIKCCLGFVFTSFVWQGHLLDLTGKRDEAILFYKKALEIEGGKGLLMKHDQYKMKVDRKWVEERLKKPFQRK